MTFLVFQDAFSDFLVIPAIEIEKRFPQFDKNALTRWQKKGYLKKIRNGFYRLAKTKPTSDQDLFFMANHIYSPSYVSLHSALRWYDFIPEGVFTITSVSTKKTQGIQTSDATFSYQSIRRELFFGYQLKKVRNYRFKIAKPEKAILDFLYLNPHLCSLDDLFELRLNITEIQAQLDMEKLDAYLSLYASKALKKRIIVFKKYLSSYRKN